MSAPKRRVYPQAEEVAPPPSSQPAPQMMNPQATGFPQPQFQQFQPTQPIQQVPLVPTNPSYPPAPPPVEQTEVTPTSISPLFQCPPLFGRMTINAVPNSMNLLNKCSIPLGCIIHPMAKPPTKEERIPVVNFGVSGIVRCRRCRGYINPFVSFTEGGRRWRCNLCNLANDIPNEYFCPLDSTGRRTDMNERPELSRGCVEFIAPSEYMVRPPQPPSYFFVIDVSYYSITSGMFHTVIHSIKSLLKSFPGHPRTRIGFLTFDSTLHFYNLKSTLSKPQMLVVTDIDDVFLPLPDDLLVNLSESAEVVEKLLDTLPTMFQSTQNVDSALGVAVKAAFEVVKHIGGKLLVFSSTLPSIGAGKLPNREDLKLLGTDKEISLIIPDDNYYKNFALDCSRQQISVDLFLCSSTYTDVATLGCMSQFTGGEVFYYPGFKADRDGEKLSNDIRRDITRETGFEAVMRVRTSRGIKVSAHYGNFFIRSTDLLALPNIDADKAFGIQLTLTDNTIGFKFVSIQTALLYTTSSGERRIRVFTHCLPVVNSLSELFRLADVEAVTTLAAKMAIEKAITGRLSDAREALVNKCIDILSVYRSDLANASSTAQLLLPESLKVFPLYILSLIKNIVFRSGTDVRPDERTAYLMLMRTLPCYLTLPFIYPRLFAVHNLSPEINVAGGILPPILNLSSEKLDRSGAFLLEDGQNMFLWIGKGISPAFLSQVFGVTALEYVDSTQTKLPVLENDLSQQLNALINEVRRQRPLFMNLHIIKEGEPRETKFFSYFVEDRTKSVHSYYEFLVNLHQRIQAKISK